jgi:hypothetical protein
MNKADHYVALALIRQIDLQRVATWVLKEALADLERLRSDIAAAALRADPGGPESAFQRRRRLSALLAEARGLTSEVMAEIRRRLQEQLTEVIAISEEDERQNFALIYGLTLAGSVAADGKTLLVGGATVAEHLERIEDELEFRIRSVLRDSTAAGKEASAIYDEIKGTPARPSPVDTAARSVEAAVRTGVDSVASEVASELEPRASVISPHGWQHVSVLDNRTTTICRGRAWKRWDAERKPVGHSLPFSPPPLHPNCRSRLVLIFLDDPEPARQTLAKWIDQFTPGQQEALFGKKNLALWRRGLLTDSQLLRQHNRPLAPADLRKRTEAKKDPQAKFPFL